MRYLLIFVLSISLGTVGIAQTKTDSVKIKTSALCEMCKEAIEYDLAFEKGVKSSNLDVESKFITVVYNPRKTDANKIRLRITKVGYDADSLKRDPKAYENLPFCCRDGH